MRTPEREVARRLEADGLVRSASGVLRTTPRWQAAMARTALRLKTLGEDLGDLRVPIAFALAELYGGALADAELADLVEAMLPIEAAELAPSP